MFQNVSKSYLCYPFSLHLVCRRSFANALWYTQYMYDSHYLSETKNIKLNELCFLLLELPLQKCVSVETLNEWQIR